MRLRSETASGGINRTSNQNQFGIAWPSRQATEGESFVSSGGGSAAVAADSPPGTTAMDVAGTPISTYRCVARSK